jgi:hypothetical protein
MMAMQEKLVQFEHNMVWTLVDRPDPTLHNVIGTKWIFHNKQDEDGIVVRNKAHLVA